MVSPFIKQCWAVAGVQLNYVAQGMMLSFPASLLPALKDPASTIKVDLQSASFLASCVGLAATLGFLGSSSLMNVLGRKLTFGAALLPAIIGWGIIFFANSVPLLIAGRLLTGVTGGATITLGAIIIGEFTDPKYRGVFLNLNTVSAGLGTMMLHIAGHYFHWRTAALISLVPLSAAFCNLLTWPESPAWLASKNRYADGEKAFYWLRGKDEDSVKEFEAVVRAQKERMAQFPETLTCSDDIVEFFKKFTRKDFLKPISIVFIGFLLLEGSGRHTFPAFAIDFIGDVSGDHSQTFLYTMCMDVITAASALMATYLVKVMKRRTLLFCSGISSVVILLSVSLYLYLVSLGVLANDKAWIPLILLVAYFVVSNLGCTSIPLGLLGEVLPLPHRGAGTAVSGIAFSFNLFLAMQATPLLMATVNTYGTFTAYALVMIFTLVIMYMILPETKNRTLQEIEDYFNHGKFLDEKPHPSDDEVKMKMLNRQP
ncbi:facilitated trehalose transporter Tret1 [Plutella xylostella]|uniref:facilitated trehalose transporter Tret1 n=1 Tax=Plutella xylostella TaxID=51655 RepID=UPI0020321962|nr:facilitated trehalose transporter Tret1 [Plutella xylostella]